MKFLLLAVMALYAGEAGLYIVYPSSFNAAEFSAIKTKLKERSDIEWQPCNMISFIVPVSTHIAPSGLLHFTPHNLQDFQKDENSVEILLQISNKIEQTAFGQQAIADGKIRKVGAVKWNKYGYVRDADFHAARQVRQDFRDKYKFKVEISTP